MRLSSSDALNHQLVVHGTGQATDKSTYQQSLQISGTTPTEELCSIVPCSNELSSISAVSAIYLSDIFKEYEQFSDCEFGIAAQQMSEVSLQEIHFDEQRVLEDRHGPPKLSPKSSSESGK